MWLRRPPPPLDTNHVLDVDDDAGTIMDGHYDDADGQSLRYCWRFDANDVDGCRWPPLIGKYLRRCTVR